MLYRAKKLTFTCNWQVKIFREFVTLSEYSLDCVILVVNMYKIFFIDKPAQCENNLEMLNPFATSIFIVLAKMQ